MDTWLKSITFILPFVTAASIWSREKLCSVKFWTPLPCCRHGNASTWTHRWQFVDTVLRSLATTHSISAFSVDQTRERHNNFNALKICNLQRYSSSLRRFVYIQHLACWMGETTTTAVRCYVPRRHCAEQTGYLPQDVEIVSLKFDPYWREKRENLYLTTYRKFWFLPPAISFPKIQNDSNNDVNVAKTGHHVWWSSHDERQ